MTDRSCQEYDRHVGARVRFFRMARGMSQEKLGEHLGLTFQQVQKYEKGRNRIGAGRLVAIAKVFSVEVATFFDGLDVKAEGGERLLDLDPLMTSRDGSALLREILNAPDHHRRALLDVARTLASTRVAA